MVHYTNEAEELFRNFANRHSLKIIKNESPHMDLLMTVPIQKGLSFELTLGLQNSDEINIGFDNFWSHIFPFLKVTKTVSYLLDGLITNNTRLATYSQNGRDVYRDLEVYNDNTWTRWYRYGCGFKIPFIGTEVTYSYLNKSTHK